MVLIHLLFPRRWVKSKVIELAGIEHGSDAPSVSKEGLPVAFSKRYLPKKDVTMILENESGKKYES